MTGKVVLQEPLRVVYVIQNAGQIDFAKDLGDTVPVKWGLRGLRRAGHQVTCLMLRGRSVIAFEDVDHPDPKPIEQGLAGSRLFLWVESAVRRLQRQLGVPYFALFDSLRLYLACIRILPNFDLCHEHNGLFGIGAALACRRLRLPYVLTFSADPLLELEYLGKPVRGFRKKIAVWFSRLTLSTARRVNCVSKAAKMHLVENWDVVPSKIAVLPNGVELELFRNKPSRKRVQRVLGFNGNPVVAFAGEFRKWHGLDVLVRSFTKVREAIPEARLLLIGDGPARSAIEKVIREHGLESVVTITGLVEQRQIPEYLKAADIATLPYPELPRELWFSPLKLYEYMAAGKAIVASKSGQIAEVIQDGESGVLVTPGDEHSLAEAIKKLLKNPPLRMQLGARAQQRAFQRHSWDRHVDQLQSIYREALSAPK